MGRCKPGKIVLVSGILPKVHFANEMRFCSSHVSFFAFSHSRVLLSMDTGHKNIFVSFDLSYLHSLICHDLQEVNARPFLCGYRLGYR